MTGAPLAHIGLALMFMGIVISGYLSKEQYLQLASGKPVTALGHSITYWGAQHVPDGKDILKMEVNDGQSTYLATPRFYFTTYNNSIMKEPFVKKDWIQDFYISPLEKVKNEHNHENNTLSLRKGEKKKFAG